jgi:hypothetical protein
LETIEDFRRKLDKANCNNIQGPTMKEEESDETKQNCNNIHDLVTTKEEEGNHQHNTIATPFKAQERRRKMMHLICLKLTMNQDF